MSFFGKLFGKKERETPVKPASTEFVVDLKKVVPRLKGIISDETPDPVDAAGQVFQASPDDSPVYKTFAQGLGVFYAMDMGTSYRLLQNRDLRGGITIEALHDAAMSNMVAEVGERTEIHGDAANIMMLTNGGNFEAAMMIADGIWESLGEMLKDQVCVAVPARDLLFISAKNNPAGRESLRQAVKKYFDDPKLTGHLVRHIYSRENGEWVLVETA